MRLAKTVDQDQEDWTLAVLQKAYHTENLSIWNYANEKTEIKTYLIDNAIIFRKIWGEKNDAAILKEFEIYKKIIDANHGENYYLVIDDSEAINYKRSARRLFCHMLAGLKDQVKDSYLIRRRNFPFPFFLRGLIKNDHYVLIDTAEAAIARIRKRNALNPDLPPDPAGLKKKSKSELIDLILDYQVRMDEREKTHREKIDRLLQKLLKINLSQNYEPQRFNAADKRDPYYDLFNAVDFLQSEVFDKITELKYLNKNLEEEIQVRTQDLTERVAAHEYTEEALTTQHCELTKLHEELDKFVYHASHDLRGPIASIQGLINVAESEKSPEALRQYIRMMAESAEKLEKLIRDITNYSWNSRIDLEVEPIDFKELIDEVFSSFSDDANFKRLSRSVSIKGDASFYSDRSRLKIIFNNIIANAIKFIRKNCPDPSIKIEVTLEQDLADITIIDNGEGISSDYIGMIFDMFFCANTQQPGAGLGLYIVKGAMDKLKGKINVQSELGEGTRFMLRIPNRTSQVALTES